jgi:hypothetical protein
MGKITKQAQTGIRHWIDSIYDNAWKKQQDEWIIRDGIMMMYLEGIKFIMTPWLLWPFDPDNQTQVRDLFPALIPDHYLQLEPNRTHQVACALHPFTGEDPGYHGGEQSQDVISDWFLEQIQLHNM